MSEIKLVQHPKIEPKSCFMLLWREENHKRKQQLPFRCRQHFSSFLIIPDPKKEEHIQKVDRPYNQLDGR